MGHNLVVNHQVLDHHGQQAQLDIKQHLLVTASSFAKVIVSIGVGVLQIQPFIGVAAEGRNIVGVPVVSRGHQPDCRHTLLWQVDEQARRVGSVTLGLMAGRQQAFDPDKELPAVCDRYGRDTFGATVLLARRLVEAGVTFVTVHTETKGNGHWDTHENNFNMLRYFLLRAARGWDTVIALIANGNGTRQAWGACRVSKKR